MSVYAVYTRAPHSTLWHLRELFPSPMEADQYAGTAVEGSEASSGEAAAAAVVVEWEQRTDVPPQLPEQWVAPVIARYGEPDVPDVAEATPGRAPAA